MSAAMRRTARPGVSGASGGSSWDSGFVLRECFTRTNSFLQCAQGYAKSGAMPTDPQSTSKEQPPHAGQRSLTPEAERALAEAAARRAGQARQKAEAPQEQGGRGGLDPTRYGDWEKDGLTSDF